MMGNVVWNGSASVFLHFPFMQYFPVSCSCQAQFCSDAYQENWPGYGRLPWQALELATSLVAARNGGICCSKVAFPLLAAVATREAARSNACQGSQPSPAQLPWKLSDLAASPAEVANRGKSGASGEYQGETQEC